MHLSVNIVLPLLVSAIPLENDADLVKQAQQDLRQFNQLYERHIQRVYRYLLVRTGNVADAQDLTSQTFLAAMENLVQYKGKRPFLAWLLGIARHKVTDHYRYYPQEVTLDNAEEIPSNDKELPDTLVSHRLQIELVARKLRTIAPDRSEALTLRLFGGLGVPEIARFMGKKETAVRMLIHRGLRDLQSQMNLTVEEPS